MGNEGEGVNVNGEAVVLCGRTFLHLVRYEMLGASKACHLEVGLPFKVTRNAKVCQDKL